ncbi:hypothetical protein PAXRUDRAFT_13866 [Paxillus rubicundulus Ve08.2h10]|uniref:Uncharacterized protein n=1 Tax=Paxillus rubicundulus Ve08.2h10 TaxID=930991 RepID=A0A0D0DJJ5_9AGAM|nr:hypothetical protein PAXRUDRAFT_13866 [Paxillus rubicundulus Ve08.2h10]
MAITTGSWLSVHHKGIPQGSKAQQGSGEDDEEGRNDNNGSGSGVGQGNDEGPLEAELEGKRRGGKDMKRWMSSDKEGKNDRARKEMKGGGGGAICRDGGMQEQNTMAWKAKQQEGSVRDAVQQEKSKLMNNAKTSSIDSGVMDVNKETSQEKKGKAKEVVGYSKGLEDKTDKTNDEVMRNLGGEEGEEYGGDKMVVDSKGDGEQNVFEVRRSSIAKEGGKGNTEW